MDKTGTLTRNRMAVTALAVDGQVKVVGKVPTVDEIKAMIGEGTQQ